LGAQKLSKISGAPKANFGGVPKGQYTQGPAIQKGIISPSLNIEYFRKGLPKVPLNFLSRVPQWFVKLKKMGGERTPMPKNNLLGSEPFSQKK